MAQQDGFYPPFPAVQGLALLIKGEELFSLPKQQRQAFFLLPLCCRIVLNITLNAGGASVASHGATPPQPHGHAAWRASSASAAFSAQNASESEYRHGRPCRGKNTSLAQRHQFYSATGPLLRCAFNLPNRRRGGEQARNPRRFAEHPS